MEAGIKQAKKKPALQSLTIYLGALVIIIIFSIVGKLAGKNFLTIGNIQNIIAQSSVIATIAIGQSIVIITGGIDLSVGSLVGFTGILGGILLKTGAPLWITCLILVFSAALIGIANGSLISYGKIPAFIVTLGSMQILRGLTKVMNMGRPISGFPTELRLIMNARIGDIPLSIIYVFILYGIMITVMRRLKLGKYIYAVGGNANAAKLAGVNTRKIITTAYVLCSIFSAIAGIFLLSRLSYADPNAGAGYELDSIAAVVIGGIAMSGGTGNILNTLVGALILGTLKSGLQILNVPVYFQTIIIGFAIIVAVFFDKARERKAE